MHRMVIGTKAELGMLQLVAIRILTDITKLDINCRVLWLRLSLHCMVRMSPTISRLLDIRDMSGVL